MKKIAFATIIAVLTFTACKKSKPEVPAPTVVGLWKGKYSLTPTSALNQDVIYYFKQDGSMRVYNGTDTATASQKGNGIWTAIAETEKTKTVLSEYFYTSSPTIGFSMVFLTDSTLSTTNPLGNLSGRNTWGTGNVIANQNSFDRKGYVFLTKQ